MCTCTAYMCTGTAYMCTGTAYMCTGTAYMCTGTAYMCTGTAYMCVLLANAENMIISPPMQPARLPQCQRLRVSTRSVLHPCSQPNSSSVRGCGSAHILLSTPEAGPTPAVPEFEGQHMICSPPLKPAQLQQYQSLRTSTAWISSRP